MLYSGRPKIMAKYGGLVQCAVAAISALESSHCAHMERLLSVEKVALLYALISTSCSYC